MATSLSVGSRSKIPVRDDLGEGTLRIGVIGYGYWGPNIVRNFHAQEQIQRRRRVRQESAMRCGAFSKPTMTCT